MTHPRISILINNFNYSRFLSQSIESALAQSYPDVQVVVVDDCSSDDSRAVIATYADRIVTVFHEHNRGQAAAINSGFRACDGEIIMLLDADDYLYSHAAAKVAAGWSAAFAKVHYRLDLVNLSGDKIDLYPAPEIRLDSGNVLSKLLSAGRYETTVTSGSAFSREALERILPAPEEEFRISADGYLAIAAPFCGPLLLIDEALGAYRQHGNNAWSTMSSSNLVNGLRRMLAHDDRKYEFLHKKARDFGYTVDHSFGMHDFQHLETRISSLRLDPVHHPYSSDSPRVLARRGFEASLCATTSKARRGVLAAWFITVGFLPNPVALRAIRWRFVQTARPKRVDRILKCLRRMTR